MMLSEYLMTIAVINPPRVCVTPVPLAQPLKLRHLFATPANQPMSA